MADGVAYGDRLVAAGAACRRELACWIGPADAARRSARTVPPATAACTRRGRRHERAAALELFVRSAPLRRDEAAARAQPF
jgi:hypothetical protein